MTDIPRRTWAPFVGAALAALTAGSLVLFSLVAQRTSLDGFPERRTAAPVDQTQGNSASITIPALGGNGPSAANGSSSDVAQVAQTSEEQATPLLPLVEIAPTAPSTIVAVADTTGSRSRSAEAGSLTPRAQSGKDVDGRSRGDGVLLSRRAESGDSKHPHGHAAAGPDRRHDGKHDHKSHEAKSKKNKSKKEKKNKSSKRHDRGSGSRSHRSGGHRAAASAQAGGSHRGSPSSSPRPKPSHTAKPSPASKPSPSGPAPHSNAGGSGKSKSKGHKKH